MGRKGRSGRERAGWSPVDAVRVGHDGTALSLPKHLRERHHLHRRAGNHVPQNLIPPPNPPQHARQSARRAPRAPTTLACGWVAMSAGWTWWGSLNHGTVLSVLSDAAIVVVRTAADVILNILIGLCIHCGCVCWCGRRCLWFLAAHAVNAALVTYAHVGMAHVCTHCRAHVVHHVCHDG